MIFDDGRVVQCLKSQVLKIGAFDAPFGAHVTVGTGVGQVTRLDKESVWVSMIAGKATVGDRVGDVSPPRYPRGQDALGRILDPLGHALDGRPDFDGERSLHRPVDCIRPSRATSEMLPTSIPTFDVLAPLHTNRANLWSTDTPHASLPLLEALLTTSRPHHVVLALPGTPRSTLGLLVRACRAAGSLERTTIFWTPPSHPNMAHVAVLAAAATQTRALSELGLPVLALLHGIPRIATALRSVSQVHGWGRCRLNWPSSLDAHLSSFAALAHLSSSPVTTVATSWWREPGLIDHVLPSFDQHVHAHTVRNVRRPRPEPALTPHPHLGLRTVQARLRAPMIRAAQQADLLTVLADPDLAQVQDTVRTIWQRLESLDAATPSALEAALGSWTPTN